MDDALFVVFHFTACTAHGSYLNFGLFSSAQEFVETRISGCFLKNDEFGLAHCHAPGLEQIA
jgi:hypothetical protein